MFISMENYLIRIIRKYAHWFAFCGFALSYSIYPISLGFNHTDEDQHVADQQNWHKKIQNNWWPISGRSRISDVGHQIILLLFVDLCAHMKEIGSGVCISSAPTLDPPVAMIILLATHSPFGNHVCATKNMLRCTCMILKLKLLLTNQ